MIGELFRSICALFPDTGPRMLPPATGDYKYLTDMERLGVQTRGDAEIARKIIKERKERRTVN